MSQNLDQKTDFAAKAEKRDGTFLGELWGLLMHNKKWWLGPILMMLLVLGLLVVLAGSSAAPFIYTLF